MPAETRNYLPKLMAVKNVIADPARFGIQLASVPNAPYFEIVTVKQHIDVKLAAKFAEMPLDEFKFLNPAHNKQVIKAYAETIVLRATRSPCSRAILRITTSRCVVAGPYRQARGKNRKKSPQNTA